MKISIIKHFALVALMAIGFTACSDDDSYATLLTDETQAVNAYLADYPVRNTIPADTVFETVEEIAARDGISQEEATKLAPFYRMDSDGNVYMQVVSAGTPGNMVASNQLIYFRFTRYNLEFLHKYGTWEGDGNAMDLGSTPTSFRFGNTTLTSTTQWGTGVQLPLQYLPIDCEVNIIIKSYVGPTEEVSAVYPYLYTHMRYFPSKV
jgi:hypothetical protein